ncbi:MAG: hypothetical protein ACI35W_01615 [Anaeroplasmataceae bacterium]
MKDKKKIIGIITIVLGAIITILGIVLYARSMKLGEYYSAEDNYTLYGERDFEEKVLGRGALSTSIILIGIAVILVGVYTLVAKDFKKGYVYITLNVIGIISALLGSSYAINYSAKVDKYINKIDPTASTDKIADKALSAYNKINGYDSPWLYVLWAMLGAILVGYTLSKLIEIYKNNKEQAK